MTPFKGLKKKFLISGDPEKHLELARANVARKYAQISKPLRARKFRFAPG